MGYLDFHMTFILPPLAAMALLVAEHRPTEHRRIYEAAILLAGLATLWATPWDNYMVATGVWTYSRDTVIATVGYIPLEEQLFFIFQPLMTVGLLGLLRVPETPNLRDRTRRRLHRTGAFVAAAVGCVSVGCILLHLQGRAPYLTAIVGWFGPVATLQLAVGFPWLARRWRTATTAVIAPTVYLCIADAIAIDQRHWTIVESKTVGIALAGLPLEEILFFLVTNAIVVGGALLYLDWYDWLRGEGFKRRLRDIAGVADG